MWIENNDAKNNTKEKEKPEMGMMLDIPNLT